MENKILGPRVRAKVFHTTRRRNTRTKASNGAWITILNQAYIICTDAKPSGIVAAGNLRPLSVKVFSLLAQSYSPMGAKRSKGRSPRFQISSSGSGELREQTDRAVVGSILKAPSRMLGKPPEASVQ